MEWGRFFLSNGLVGLDATVIIKIRSNGTFSYLFTNYSGNSEFDSRLKEFLDVQSIKIRNGNTNKGIYSIKTTFNMKE